ncbi:MAG: hypothetical protein V1933_05620 [Candidatus Omnitrophota bacterium]
MNKIKQRLIILAVLVLLFFAILAFSAFKSFFARALVPKMQLEPRSESRDEEADFSRERGKSSFEDWGRDPFIAGSSVLKSSNGLVLTGIIYDRKGRYCIINEKIFKKGDQILGFDIIEIKKDSVTLRSGDKIKVLKIGLK